MDCNKYLIRVSHQANILLNDSYRLFGDITVVNFEEDDRPPYCMITSPHLTSLDKPEEVWARALSLLSLYNGANNLFADPYSDYIGSLGYNLKVTGIVNWRKDLDITPRDTFEILPFVPFDPSLVHYPVNMVIDPEDKIGNLLAVKTNKRSYYIYLAKSNEDVKNLLLQLGLGLDWINLYCILDSTKYYSKSVSNEFFNNVVLDSGLTLDDVKAFTGTANNFGLIGLSARHGEMGWGTPNRTVDLKEAQKIILSIVQSYLKIKYP